MSIEANRFLVHRYFDELLKGTWLSWISFRGGRVHKVDYCGCWFYRDPAVTVDDIQTVY